MRKIDQRLYTAAQLETYRTRIFRQHQQELQATRETAFAQGVQLGQRDAQNSMRVALGLPLLDEDL